ncbi:hypothetical protein B9U28_004622 [Salmonella enterica subsp. enterica serovar Javiana]|nr:hypothetical protein [Salmonella enterica subsp. enterica serovar Javiana]
MAFFYAHYVLIYQTVTSLTYVFVPLDFRPRYGAFNAPTLARGATFEALAPMFFSYPLVKGDNSNVFLFCFSFST